MRSDILKRSAKCSLLLFVMLLAEFSLTAQDKMTRQDYVEEYSIWAVQEMESAGIPASITIAQGILESSSGNSLLTRKANNHFGIKCHKGWAGKGYYMDDDAKDECFRVYKSAHHSFQDHSAFLSTRSRYASLFILEPDDYMGWARGLKKAGYATNPKYADLLIRIIDDLGLTAYDEISSERLIALSKERNRTISTSDVASANTATNYIPDAAKDGKLIEINGVPAVLAGEDESLLSLAVRYNVDRRLLAKYNELKGNKDLATGSIVFMKPKKRKGDVDMHIVKAGESMYQISQMHGVKIANLYKRNLMNKDKQPVVGELVYLRKKRDTAPKQRSYREYLKEVDDLKNEELRLAKARKLKEQQKEQEKLNEIAKAESGSTKIKEKVEPKEDREPAELIEAKAEKVSESIQNPKEKAPEKTIETVQEVPPVQPEKVPVPRHHVVKSGDTLYALKRKYGVEVQELMTWNNLSSPNINIGQKLIVGK